MLLAPMEATKVRIQTQASAPPTLRGCAPFIYKAEGLSGFYKGLPPLWARQVRLLALSFFPVFFVSKTIVVHFCLTTAFEPKNGGKKR